MYALTLGRLAIDHWPVADDFLGHEPRMFWTASQDQARGVQLDCFGQWAEQSSLGGHFRVPSPRYKQLQYEEDGLSLDM